MAYELAIGSMFRNEAPYFKEWIEYHRLVGVEHFWLYNDSSTDSWEEVLAPYIEEGIVEVIDVAVRFPERSPDWVARQIMAFKDAIQRAVGVTKWVALIDLDEFLLPIQNKTIKECLNQHYTRASAVFVNWRNFGTGGVYLKEGEPILSNLIACSSWDDGSNVVGKTIVRPECVILGQVWYPHHFPLVEESTYFDGEGNASLRRAGVDWIPNGIYHEKYLRINHYILRDESYFKNVKLPRSPDSRGILRLYDNCKERNEAILQFLQKYHPEKYSEIWDVKQ